MIKLCIIKSILPLTSWVIRLLVGGFKALLWVNLLSLSVISLPLCYNIPSSLFAFSLYCFILWFCFVCTLDWPVGLFTECFYWILLVDGNEPFIVARYEVCWDDRGLAFTDFGKAGSLRKSKLPSKFNIRSGFDVALWRPSTCFNFGTLALSFTAL